MKEVKYDSIVTPQKISNAAVNNEFTGFKEDYYVIHCLISEWKPKTVFEIGTNTGFGCVVIQNAHPEVRIKTLDIVPRMGHLCPAGVEKLVGDSLSYDFSNHYPIECWFIDGEHEYPNAYHETKEAIKSNAKYIIYHDADLDKVKNGIIDAFKDTKSKDLYELYFVVDPPFIYSSTGKSVTRVAYAIKK